MDRVGFGTDDFPANPSEGLSIVMVFPPIGAAQVDVLAVYYRSDWLFDGSFWFLQHEARVVCRM